MNLLPLYPLYTDLDNLRDKYKSNKINIFLDLKNALMTGLTAGNNSGYKAMIESSGSDGKETLEIFHNWLYLIDFYYSYMERTGCDVKIYTIADAGEYLYHKSIYPDYKKNRLVTKSKTESFLSKDDFSYIRMNNIEKIMHASYHMFNTYKSYLSYCESDFVPYFVIDTINDSSCINLICSNDRDMLQTLVYPNTVLMRKYSFEREFSDKESWYHIYDIPETSIDKMIYMKAIAGDSGDNVPGIKGIGFKRACTIVNSIGEFKDFDDFLSKVTEYIDDPKIGKYCVQIINNKSLVYMSYRLVSFKELISSLSEMKKKDIVQSSPTKMSFDQSKQFISMMLKKFSERGI